MNTEKFTKKTARNTEEWGSPNEYSNSKRQKTGSKKSRRQNDKRDAKWDE